MKMQKAPTNVDQEIIKKFQKQTGNLVLPARPTIKDLRVKQMAVDLVGSGDIITDGGDTGGVSVPLQIPTLYTFQLGNIWSPANRFRLFDPFGIAVIVNCSANLIQNAQTYVVEAQVINPTDDEWELYIVQNKTVHTHKVMTWDLPPQRGTFEAFSFNVHWNWNSYKDFIRFVGNGEKLGVFGIRAWIRVDKSPLYAIKGNIEQHNYVLRD